MTIRPLAIGVPGPSPGALDAALLLAPMALLVALRGPGIGPIALGSVALAGVLLSYGLRRSARPDLGELWIVPALGAAVGIASLSPPTLLAGVLAAFSGLALLNWTRHDSSDRYARAARGTALLLPGAGTALALGLTIVLPQGPERLGVASFALALALLLLAGVLAARPAPPEAGPTGS